LTGEGGEGGGGEASVEEELVDDVEPGDAWAADGPWLGEEAEGVEAWAAGEVEPGGVHGEPGVARPVEGDVGGHAAWLT
jgi:hypothetical protein